MKKAIVLLAMLALCNVLSAQKSTSTTPPDGPPRPMDEWTFFQIGFAPNVPGYTRESNVYGLKLGIPMTSGWGRVNGIEAAGIYSGTNYVNGIQAAWFGVSVSREVNGIQATWFGPCVSRIVYGMQACWGICVADEIIGIQASAVNICKEFYGFQASAVNIAKPFYGFQAGAVNIADSVEGVQLGVVNVSKHNGCQFGLVNIIEDGWLPFMVLFNVSFKDAE